MDPAAFLTGAATALAIARVGLRHAFQMLPIPRFGMIWKDIPLLAVTIPMPLA